MYPVYSLIRIEAGRLERVLEQLEKVMGVVDITPVTGKYDVVVKVESDWLVDALQVVSNSIHCLDGIISTETLVAIPMDASAVQEEKRKKSLYFNM